MSEVLWPTEKMIAAQLAEAEEAEILEDYRGPNYTSEEYEEARIIAELHDMFEEGEGEAAAELHDRAALSQLCAQVSTEEVVAWARVRGVEHPITEECPCGIRRVMCEYHR